MGQHAVAPLPLEEVEHLFLCPSRIEVTAANRDKAAVPENLVVVVALGRNRECAAVVAVKDALRSIDELLLGRTLARTLRRGCQDSGPRHSKEAETRSSELSDRHHTLTPHEVSAPTSKSSAIASRALLIVHRIPAESGSYRSLRRRSTIPAVPYPASMAASQLPPI